MHSLCSLPQPPAPGVVAQTWPGLVDFLQTRSAQLHGAGPFLYPSVKVVDDCGNLHISIYFFKISMYQKGCLSLDKYGLDSLFKIRNQYPNFVPQTSITKCIPGFAGAWFRTQAPNSHACPDQFLCAQWCARAGYARSHHTTLVNRKSL